MDQSQSQARERISALADGALAGPEAEAALDALLNSGEGQAFWNELHAVGDCLRSDEMADTPTGFMTRFGARMASEPSHLPGPALRARAAGPWRRVALPLAATAAGAVLVFWASAPAPEAPVVAAGPQSTAAPVVAVAPTAAKPESIDPDQLGVYVDAHRGFIQAALVTSQTDRTGQR